MLFVANAVSHFKPYYIMIAQEEIEQIISKLESLEDEKISIVKNIADTLSEAKIRGYDIKILRQLLRLRKLDEDERIRQEEELETYKAALGMK